MSLCFLHSRSKARAESRRPTAFFTFRGLVACMKMHWLPYAQGQNFVPHGPNFVHCLDGWSCAPHNAQREVFSCMSALLIVLPSSLPSTPPTPSSTPPTAASPGKMAAVAPRRERIQRYEAKNSAKKSSIVPPERRNGDGGGGGGGGARQKNMIFAKRARPTSADLIQVI